MSRRRISAHSARWRPASPWRWRSRSLLPNTPASAPIPISQVSAEGRSSMPVAPQLDVITIGRSSVDLYGQQIGGRLEDMGSFLKAVGGCPTNIAIGTARLGLKSAVITRVGDEQMGRFIREQLERE